MYKNFDKVIEYAINFRHNLHKNPELKWEETDTAKNIRDVLEQHGIPYKT